MLVSEKLRKQNFIGRKHLATGKYGSPSDDTLWEKHVMQPSTMPRNKQIQSIRSKFHVYVTHHMLNKYIINYTIGISRLIIC